jgi:iron complex transport system ATP-binding protein
MPTVMVSHHLEDLPSSVTHVLLLRDGRVLAAGPARELLTSEMITACYGFPIDVHEWDGRWSARAAAGWTVSHHHATTPSVWSPHALGVDCSR